MKIEYSVHWLKKKEKKKKDITDDIIEYTIRNSEIFRDKRWEEVFNAAARIPPSGRTLKVVYKKGNQKIFIITAYWLD